MTDDDRSHEIAAQIQEVRDAFSGLVAMTHGEEVEFSASAYEAAKALSEIAATIREFS